MLRLLFGATAAMLCAAPAFSQCQLSWLPGLGVPGADRAVSASTLWDPDGAGPLPEMIVVGGDFQVVGNTPAARIAMYDRVAGTWTSLGGVGPGLQGTNGRVSCLAVLPNGELVAGGDFTIIGGVGAARVAVYQSGSWQPLGSGVSYGSGLGGTVLSLLPLPSGELIVGGGFGEAGGVFADSVARWDGAAWQPMPNAPGSVTAVRALALASNGDIVAGGRNSISGSNQLLRWNGVSWSAFGGGFTFAGNSDSADIYSIVTLSSGDLLVGGYFDAVGGAPISRLGVWNGLTWTDQGVGNGAVYDTAIAANGDILAAGTFGNLGGAGPGGISRRSAATGTWSQVGPGLNGANTVSLLGNGDVMVGGSFAQDSAPGVANCAIRAGNVWEPLGPRGLTGPVRCVESLQNGDLVIGGDFRFVAGVPVNGIARWDGSSWSAFAAGSAGPVVDLLELPSGDLIATGKFVDATGQDIRGLARWDGSAWTQLGYGLPIAGGQLPWVAKMALAANGDLIVIGTLSGTSGPINGVARFDGLLWSSVGVWDDPDTPTAVVALPNGNLVVSGRNVAAVSTVVREWDGSSWTQLGGDFGLGLLAGNVSQLALDANGDLLAAGAFYAGGGAPGDYLVRWTGSAWVPVSSSVDYPIGAMLSLPNGDLLLSPRGVFPPYAQPPAIARLSNGVLTSLDPSTATYGTYTAVDLAMTTQGSLVIGGLLGVVGGSVSSGFAVLETSCPASAVAAGAGCPSSGGNNELVATSLPWLGASFTAHATGLPSNSLAVAVRGLGTLTTPLSTILPQGQVGCSLLVTPDLLDLYVPSNGQLEAGFDIPNVTALVGQVLHQQVVPIEIDAAGNLAAVTSSNRLTLTLGQF